MRDPPGEGEDWGKGPGNVNALACIVRRGARPKVAQAVQHSLDCHTQRRHYNCSSINSAAEQEQGEVTIRLEFRLERENGGHSVPNRGRFRVWMELYFNAEQHQRKQSLLLGREDGR